MAKDKQTPEGSGTALVSVPRSGTISSRVVKNSWATAAKKKRAMTIACALKDDFVTLYAEFQQHKKVPREILFLRVPYLAEEYSHSDSIRIDDISVITLNLFITWLYMQCRKEAVDHRFWNLADSADFGYWVQLGYLAEQWEIDDLKKIIIRSLEKWFVANDFADEYELTSAYTLALGSSWRLWAVRSAVVSTLRIGNVPAFIRTAIQEVREFAQDFATYLTIEAVSVYEDSELEADKFVGSVVHVQNRLDS